MYSHNFRKIDPISDVSLAFSKTFSNTHMYSKLACLVIFFGRHLLGAPDILQNKVVIVQRRIQEPCYSDERSLSYRSKWKTEKRLFPTEVNEKLKNVYSGLKTLFVDVSRFLGFSLKFSNHNCWNVTQNCY